VQACIHATILARLKREGSRRLAKAYGSN